jgi:copper chaperone
MDVIVKVGGMTCQGCVRSVKKALEAIGGVEQAEVSLEQGQVRVSFDPAQTGLEAFKAAIADAGYEPSRNFRLSPELPPGPLVQ